MNRPLDHNQYGCVGFGFYGQEWEALDPEDKLLAEAAVRELKGAYRVGDVAIHCLVRMGLLLEEARK